MNSCRTWIIAIALVFVGCEETENHAPSIHEILVTNDPGTETPVTLNAIATDDDGDSLSHSWDCEFGSFSNSGLGNPIEWIVSDSGTYSITCYVSDGIEVSDKTVSLSVSRSTAILSGSVRDAVNYFPITEATVLCCGQSTISDSSGFYQIQDLPIGHGKFISVTHPDYIDMTLSLSIEPGDNSKHIYLYRQRGTLSGYVYDSETLEPIESATLSIDEFAANSRYDGAFTLSDIPVGHKNIHIWAYGYTVLIDTIRIMEGTQYADYYMEPDTL